MKNIRQNFPTISPDVIQKEILSACGLGIIILDEYLRVIHWNSWVDKHTGIPLDKARGEFFEVLFSFTEHARIQNSINDALYNRLPSTLSFRLNGNILPLTMVSGQPLSHNVRVAPISYGDDKTYCLLEITDISSSIKREKQLKDISTQLRQEKEWANATFLSIADGVMTTDSNGNILSINGMAETITGWTNNLAEGISFRKVCPLHKKQGASSQLNSHPIGTCLKTSQAITDNKQFEFLNYNNTPYAVALSISPILDYDNSILGSVCIFRDVTEDRAISDHLKWQARHDSLTGLMNRHTLVSELEALRVHTANTDNTHCLLYMDIDQFKIVNDTCGHSAGDDLLRLTTSTIKQQLRQGDLFARIASDEFCVLLPNCPQNKAQGVANLIRQAVREQSFIHEQKPFSLSVSIGISQLDKLSSSAENVLSAADSACYMAKNMGRDRVHQHNSQNSEEYEDPQQAMHWYSRLQAALQDNRFILYSQKITPINGHNDTPHHEVLIRMLDEDGKIIPPNSFIPAAERFNLMQNIDRWVIEHVCIYLSEIQTANKPTPAISINLSGMSIGDQEFLQNVISLFEKYDTPSDHICFEITETAAITHLPDAIKFMTEMKKRHCKFALDDFGSGLSSFAYLKDLPVDYLKIDGHFVKDITTDPVDKAFVESIHQISRVMKIQTIAEFVENDEILAVLKEIGVDYAQGYGIARPEPLIK